MAKTYQVTWTEKRVTTWQMLVEAETEEEAREAFLKGEYDEDDPYIVEEISEMIGEEEVSEL